MQALCSKSESFTRLLDEAECYRQLRQFQWPDGKVRCPYCGSDHIVKSWIYFREPACARHQCGTCGRSFNDKAGTIFEGSKLPLSAWFHGFYLAQLSQSTATIAREVPCDYHTARRIVWLVREQVLHLEAGCVLTGTIEVDEIYIRAGHKGQARGAGARALPFPPRWRGKKRGRGRGSAAKDSPAVVTMVGREQGQVVLAVVPDVKRESLEPPMTQAIASGTVCTDSAQCYNLLQEVGYHHESVNHSQGEYVRGQVHEIGRLRARLHKGFRLGRSPRTKAYNAQANVGLGKPAGIARIWQSGPSEVEPSSSSYFGSLSDPSFLFSHCASPV